MCVILLFTYCFYTGNITVIEVDFSARRSGCCFTIFKPQFAKKVLDKAATCQNFLHYILTMNLLVFMRL